MILDEVKKVIKQNCKKQGRNITTGVVVAFLLGTMGAYAADKSKDIYVEEINGAITVTQNGTPITEIEKDVKVEGNKIIFGETFNSGDREIFTDKSVNNLEIENHGSITNGITLYNLTENNSYDPNNPNIKFEERNYILTNTGLIAGNSNSVMVNYRGDYLHGYGIYIDSKDATEKIKITLKNEGIIAGKYTSQYNDSNNIGGNAIFINGFYNIENKGMIKGTHIDNHGWKEEGNGIYTLCNLLLKGNTIDNEGIILGQEEKHFKIKDGRIGYSCTANGIVSGHTIDKITNKGFVLGKSTGEDIQTSGFGEEYSGTGVGIGVFSLIGNNDIINTGMILGSNLTERKRNYSAKVGIGISYSEELNENPNDNNKTLTNKGAIIGKNILTADKVDAKYDDAPHNSYDGGSKSGNGIYNFDVILSQIINIGVILGKSKSNSIDEIPSYPSAFNKNYSGNGIYNRKQINDITNIGVIFGKNNNENKGSGYKNQESLGNGIYNYIAEKEDYNAKLKNITNYGVIGGSHKAIGGVAPENKLNYGLLVSENKNYDGPDKGKVEIEAGANGVQNVVIDLDGNDQQMLGNRYIINGAEKDNTGVTVAKAISSEDLAKTPESYKNKNLIINVVGEMGTEQIADTGFSIKSGNDITISDSIINGYKNAVVFNGGKFTGNNIIINAGEKTFAGKGNTNDTLVLLNNSTVNGNIDLGAGDDNVEINNTVQINGDLEAGDGTDTLAFSLPSIKSVSNSNINLFHNISGFENVNVNSNVTLFETAKIEGTKNLNIDTGSQMTLRVDSSERNADGTYKTHALYNDKDDTLIISGKIPNENIETEENKDKTGYEKISILNIITNGLGINSIIDFGNAHFITNDKINEVEKPNNMQNKTEVWVKTDSILHGAKVNETKLDNGKYDTNIIINAKKDLYSIGKKPIVPPVDPDKPPDKPNGSDKYGDLYIKLNEVYKGIYSSNDRNFNALNDIVTNYTFGDKDKSDYPVVGNEKMQMATLLGYLRSVYSETPYSFSNESTRKSMGLFHDTVRDNNFKAKEDEWLIYGGLVHQSGDQEQTYYGRNYHGFDTGTADTDAEIKLTGAYGQFEYGNTDTLSTGIMVGGTKSDVEVASSKLKGTGAYVGVYAKKDIKDLRLTAGAGYQYTEYDGTRRTINETYSEDYKDNAFNLYLDGKYSYDLGNNLYLVPKAGLSYTHIDQDGIKESNDKTLALNIDSKEFDVLEGTVGVDIKKVIPTEKGKHSVSAGVSYRHILDGADADYLTADFGGNDFEILVPHKNKGQMSIGVRYEAELENGMFYDVKGNYFMNVDSKENTHKNADRGEWRVGVGIGYKFTTLKELALTSLFDFDKSEIRPEGKEMLKNIATKLNGRANGTLIIEGHTDSVGSEKYNQTLSEKRVNAVEKELKANVTNKKVDYSTKGYGETKPIADNNTEEGRAANRRVELKFNKR